MESHEPDDTRRASSGDISPDLSADGIERFVVNNAMTDAVEERLGVIKEVLASARPSEMRDVADWLNAVVEGTSPDELLGIRRMLQQDELLYGEVPMSDDDVLAENWASGAYPYENLLSRKSYEAQKYHLQVELLKLQSWTKHTGQRVVIVFEGRDAAGKGGAIKRFMEHLKSAGRTCRRAGEAHRGRARAVVLPALCTAPSDQRRARPVRPVLVQPGGRGEGHGVRHRRRGGRVLAAGAPVRAQPHP